MQNQYYYNNPKAIPQPYMQSGVQPVMNAQAPPPPPPQQPQNQQQVIQQQQDDQQLTQAVNDFVNGLPPEIQKLLSTINPNTFNQALTILNQIADEALNIHIQT